VDDWLDKDDPRMMREDLTDRFDFSFIFGDLNFRLNISRLHADWLISRKDYAQALAFDQLQNLMQKGGAFMGFKEAPINFPPTFKYDVLRTSKRHKTKSNQSAKNIGENHITEIPLIEAHEIDHEVEEEDGEGDEGGEAISIASSAFTSVHSRITIDQELDGEDCFMRSNTSRASTGNLVGKFWAVAAAHKAKVKWISRLQRQAPGRLSPLSKPVGFAAKLKRFSSDGKSRSSYVPSVVRTAQSTPPVPTDTVSSESLLPSPSLDRSIVGTSSQTDPPNPEITSAQGEEDTDERVGGIYDTSSKQRVPSWYV
jgi:hypothetical protein